jgi:cysteine desulfuration protein SufE
VSETGEEQPPRLHFQADIDPFIVKGLVAILMKDYSGKTAQEILDLDIEQPFERLGLGQQLTPNRRDGLVAMVKQIRARAQATTAQA